MTSFWVAVVVMAVVAVGFVVWPLVFHTSSSEAAVDREATVLDLFNEHLHNLQAQLQRGELDQSQFDQLKQELELSLLEDSAEVDLAPVGGSRRVLYAVAVILPLLAVAFYWQRGSIADVEIVEQRLAFFQSSSSEMAADELSELIANLERRLDSKPDNLGNRYLLARSYAQQGEYVKAVGAYTRIVQSGDTPAYIMGELAQAVFLAAGNRNTPEVEQLVARVLSLDANETTALGLAGIGAFEKQQYQQAIAYWERAVHILGPQSNASASLLAGIDRAKSLMGDAGVVAQAPSAHAPQKTDNAAPEVGQASIVVQVALAGSVEFSPGDTVFVYARAWQGARVPLAITRMTAADLPATVRLDESMAMAPGMTITNFPQLEVLARVSKSGQPVPQPGDWQGSVGPVVLADLSGPVKLSIDQRLP